MARSWKTRDPAILGSKLVFRDWELQRGFERIHSEKELPNGLTSVLWATFPGDAAEEQSLKELLKETQHWHKIPSRALALNKPPFTLQYIYKKKTIIVVTGYEKVSLSSKRIMCPNAKSSSKYLKGFCCSGNPHLCLYSVHDRLVMQRHCGAWTMLNHWHDIEL